MRIVLMIMLVLNLAIAKKVALVIGNNDYQKGALSNPINDAKLIKKTLEDLDFSVIYRTNLEQNEMKKVINDFATSVGSNDIALFYYSGHGMQFEGKNYLIPIGANAVKAGQIPSVGVGLDFILGGLYDTKLAIVLLDACRNAPFKSFSRGSSKGLAQVGNLSGNYIVSYATEAGKEASDGDGENSPYALALQKYFKEPLPIETVFRKVRGEVKRVTGNQYPYFEPHFDGEFYFTLPTISDKIVKVKVEKAPKPTISDSSESVKLTKIKNKVTECKNTADMKLYFKVNFPSVRESLSGNVFSQKEKAISTKKSNVYFWTTDDSLVSECSDINSWRRVSSLSPGDNKSVVGLLSNCTYHKPQNKQNRFLQFSYEIGLYDISYTKGKLFPSSYNMQYFTMDDLKNHNTHSKSYKNIGFTNLKMLDRDCINIELQYCGDGVVENKEGEECDPEAVGYSSKTCNTDTCKLK